MNTLIFIIFFGLYILFTWKSGKTYPIMYLFLFVYFVQYIFSVYLIYNEFPVLKKEMMISQEQLFSYCIPAFLFLFAGVFLFNKDIDVSKTLKEINPRNAAVLGHLLIGVSFFFDGLSLIGISGLKSMLSFTHYLRYIGAMCYLFAPSPLNYSILTLVYVGLARDALRGGVFIDFFIWSAYLFLLMSHRFQLSFRSRLAFIMLAAPMLILIQSVKQEYRESTWSGKQQSGLGFLSGLVAKEQAEKEDPFATESSGIVSTVGRLNQGWHLGMVLKRVPSKQPYANGADMFSDLAGVAVPRLLYEGKKVAGGQDKFSRYTGHKILGNTSMTIGVLGDFYINFGTWGSYIGLFIFGALMSRLFYGFMKKYVVTDPLNIVWVPFLFSYLIRANNDFYMVVNTLFKGFIIFLAITYLRKQFWPDHSFPRR